MPKYLSFKPGLTLKGKKFKGIRGFAGKPFHPPLTDITVGAYFIWPIFYIGAFLFKDGDRSGTAFLLYQAAKYVLVLGLIASVPTVLTGFWDWLRSTPKGTQARRMVNAHAWTMVATNVLNAAALFTFGRLGLFDDNLSRVTFGGDGPSVLTLVLGLLVLLFVTVGGTLGGDLVFSWGFNVEVAKDHPVWHPSDSNDYVSPHQEQPPKVEG